MSEEGSWCRELLSYSERRFDHVDERLDDLGNVLVEIARRVQTVSEDQRSIQERVETVYSELCEFIAADRQAKELQRALTEIVRVRQEIDKRFGRFDQVRSAAVGILQASSLELVRKNTLHNMAEELMAQTARYWLPPALLALSAWVIDDRPLLPSPERGVAECRSPRTTCTWTRNPSRASVRAVRARWTRASSARGARPWRAACRSGTSCRRTSRPRGQRRPAEPASPAAVAARGARDRGG